jgi:electron transfer flavoprotein alpha subunit
VTSTQDRGGGVLVVAEHLRGHLRDVTKELVGAARDLRGPVTMAIIAHHPEAFIGEASLEGVDQVITLAVEADEFEVDPYARALEAVVVDRQPSAVLLGFTVSSMGFAPAVAARRGMGFASDVFALRQEGEAIVATRSFYGGKVHAEVELPSPPILLLRPTTWPAASGSSQPSVAAVAVPAGPSRARHTGYEEAAPTDVDITTADFLLSIGRGIGERESIETFQRLAEKMGATLSASRPLVDAGWLPASRQVGQSGKTVKPRVYLAFGISGAVQHLAGMKGSGTIVAVNTDPDAAIFNVAHYGAAVDLFEVAGELEKLY